MSKETILEKASALLRCNDPYSLDWGLDELSKAIKRNMDETAEALDQDFFPVETVVFIAQSAKEATEYTGISSLSKALVRWVERHPEKRDEIGPYAEEAAKSGESVPF